jgi:CDGSH-type Zn-finger protein
MSDRLSVVVLPDGPLEITGARSLTFGGAPLPADGTIYLCRCGQSANAPFCDGSHRRVGFDGGNAPRPTHEVKVWEGRTVRTRFNPNTCMHVFLCKPLNDLRARELAGDDSAAAEIAAVVQSCPSGALTWEAKGDVASPPGEAPADVAIQEGGEVRIQCAHDINAERMEHQPDDRATLCRCGLSANKPWCDGRHRKRTDWR